MYSSAFELRSSSESKTHRASTFWRRWRWLMFFNRWCSIRHGIGVVEPRADDWAGNHVAIADGDGWSYEYVAIHVGCKKMCDWLRSRACPSTGDCRVWRRVAWRGPPLNNSSTQRWPWWSPRKNESVAGFRRDQSQIYQDWGKGVRMLLRACI